VALGNYRILKSKGRVTLVETANPAKGFGYSVRSHGTALWSGEDLAEAEKHYEAALTQTHVA
jgi:hypothetical protein